MKNAELYSMREALNNLKSYSGNKFAIFVAKNLRLINQEIEDLEEAIKPTEDFQEYEKTRMETATKYAEKDENGNPKTKVDSNTGQQIYDLTEKSKEEFQKEMKEMDEKYKDTIEKHNEKMQYFYNNILTDEVDESLSLNLKIVKEDDIPTNVSADLIEPIIDLIE